MPTAYRAAALFDGYRLFTGAVLVVEEGRVVQIQPADLPLPEGCALHDLGGGLLAPGFIDLQVNGGDGLMVGAGCDGPALARICAAHARLGATGILPTLITDRPEVTAQVIEAGIAAAREGVAGFLGLHLEGPHLDPRRHGAHDPALIRPMDEDDLARLEAAARALPALMITLAPEAASDAQIARLAAAGAVVSLGHSDCSEARAREAFAAGARAVTHLFNAMSQLGNRAPGLVGAALDGPAACGIIADGLHVADSNLRLALRARPAGGLFLVSDAMAVAGTEAREFTLGGRRIRRTEGRLTLADGTLAGADISLPQSVAHLIEAGGEPARVLAMASRVPAAVIGRSDLGQLKPGAPADFVHLGPSYALRGVWRAGEALAR